MGNTPLKTFYLALLSVTVVFSVFLIPTKPVQADDCTGHTIVINWQANQFTAIIDGVPGGPNKDYSYIWQNNAVTLAATGYNWTETKADQISSGDQIKVFATKATSATGGYTLSTFVGLPPSWGSGTASGSSNLNNSSCQVKTWGTLPFTDYKSCVAAGKGVGYCNCFFNFPGTNDQGCQDNASSFVCSDGKTPLPANGSPCPTTTNTTCKDNTTCPSGQTCDTTKGVCVTSSTNPPPAGPGDLPGNLYNPLKTENLTDTLLLILKGFLGIIGIWAVTFVVIGGFKMILAQGDEEAYTSAKKTITWAILGLVIAVMSFALIAMVQNLLGVTTK